LPRTFSPRPRPSGSVTPRPGSPSLRVPVVNRDPAAGMARTTVRAPIRLLCLRRSDELEAASVDASTRRAYHDGSRDPIPWSPFLRVGARTLRTEQCAKSQCVFPVDLGRRGSPCLPARRSYGIATQEGRSGCAARGGRLSNNEPETGPTQADGAGSNGSLRRV